MAPKEPFKVHSLSKHIEDTKKGLSAEAQYNRRPVARPSAAVKREPGVLDSNIFGHNTDSEDDSSDSSSDDEDGAEFLKKLGAKTSTAPKRRGQDEEIADSDVERNTSAKTAATVKQEKHVLKKSASSSSETSEESSSESESEKSEPKVKTNGVKVKDSASTSETSSSSSEDGSDSEEDNEESGAEEEEPKETTKKPAVKATTNGTAKATTSDSSSEESEESEEEEDDDEEEEPAKPVQKKTQAAEESSSSESEASDDEDQEDDENVDESMHISERENSTQVTIPNFIAPDFMLRKGDDGANGQDVARICNEANLQGKQFWYFTVPSNIPISVVQNLEIPTDRSQLGDRIFSHDGQDYGVSFDTMTPKSSIQILIPSANSSNYQPARHQVEQTMQIKRITNLGSAGSSDVGPAPNRAPRPQPKGLKARYQPFGVNTPMGKIGADASSDGDEDVEMAEAPASPVAQKSSKKDKKKHKKSEEVVEPTPVEQPKSKKDKKKRGDSANEPAASQTTSLAAEVQTPKADRKGKRKHSAEEDVAAAEKLLEKTNTSTQTKTKKQKTGRTGSPDLGSEPPSAAKKQTPIAPPTIPQSSYSFASLGSAPVASTPPPKAKEKAPVASSAVKKSTKAKAAAAAPASSQTAPATGKKETPVPVPRQTAVPLPMILSARPKESPVPIPPTGAAATPTPAKAKKAKKQKDDEAKAPASSQQSPLAKSGERKKTPAIKSKKLG